MSAARRKQEKAGPEAAAPEADGGATGATVQGAAHLAESREDEDGVVLDGSGADFLVFRSAARPGRAMGNAVGHCVRSRTAFAEAWP